MVRQLILHLFLIGIFPANAIEQNFYKTNARIVGGNETTIEDNPWQVSLEALGFRHTCGGCLISPDVVLTAAHCINNLVPLFYEIVSGTADLLQGGTHSKIKEIIVHEEYDQWGNDVAIIKLKEALVYTEKIRPIPLVDVEPVPGDSVRVTGWGVLNENDTITPNILHSVDVNIIDREQCEKDYANIDIDGAHVDNTMICAGVSGGGKDACFGDSGGPLTKNGTLVGLVSWGIWCGHENYPKVYTNIASVRAWIKQKTEI